MRKSSKIISLIKKGHPSYTGVSCNKYYYITDKNAHYIVRLKIDNLNSLEGVPYSVISDEDEVKINNLFYNCKGVNRLLLDNNNNIDEIITPLLIGYLNNKHDDKIAPDIRVIINLLDVFRCGNEALVIYLCKDTSIYITNNRDLTMLIAPIRVKEVKDYED